MSYRQTLSDVKPLFRLAAFVWFAIGAHSACSSLFFKLAEGTSPDAT